MEPGSWMVECSLFAPDNQTPATVAELRAFADQLAPLVELRRVTASVQDTNQPQARP